MQVLFEDNHLIAVSKAVGEIVQGDKTGDRTLIDEVKSYIKERYRKPGDVFLGLVHRIDRPTSGVVVFARTSKALSRLNDMFRSHEQVRKTYWAIVEGKPRFARARLENWLIRREAQNKTYIAREGDKDAKQAILSYRVLAEGDRYSLLEVDLQTGRHHQIRCQLSAIGHPIKGDLKYGAKRSNRDGGICLHARQLSFIHPVSKQQLDIVAPLPSDSLWKSLEEKISENTIN